MSLCSLGWNAQGLNGQYRDDYEPIKPYHVVEESCSFYIEEENQEYVRYPESKF